jgi:hypothetical protein
VHSARLERLGECIVACSSETIAAHWVEELAAEASASRRLDDVLGNSVHTSADEQY